MRKMHKILIGNKGVGEGYSTFIIAEAGVNHNGSLKLAKTLIYTAKESGADAVKFQTFKTEDLVTKNAEKTEYQKKSTTENSQYEMIKKLELSKNDFRELAKYADKNDIIFLSSPFDLGSVDLLDEIGIPAFKLGSGEITNFSLLEHVATKGRPVILSTGMATMNEIGEAVKLFNDNANDLILMHCVTSYPAKIEDINLKVIETLRSTFKLPVGFSDHTLEIQMPQAAVALGSCIIEKHFTIDKNLDGPDHKASLEPNEFTEMVESIRNVEKCLGNGKKRLTKEEIEIKKIVRKSIVAKYDIRRGTILNKDMLDIKRPGTGIKPKYIHQLIGKELNENVKKDSLIKWDQMK
jgi:N,N'-diacetyllegionaminate synthase